MAKEEYVVTVKEDADWKQLHDELVANGVEVAHLKPQNKRNTHYNLTDGQAKNIQDDPRVLSVQRRAAGNYPTYNAIQTGDFEKTNADNWGLLRHTSKTNLYGTSMQDPGVNYNYVLDGTGVDVVIIDTGIQPDHPEFQDANGVSRVKQINWYEASGQSGIQDSNHYADADGHGTHVAGTVAGKTYGWAKNANIYSIKLNELANVSGGITYTDVFDVLIGWHNAKSGSRPTVVNVSLGWAFGISTQTSTAFLMDNNNNTLSDAPATGGLYRGVSHTDVNGIKFRENYGFQGWMNGTKMNGFMLGQTRLAGVDANIKTCVDAGMIFCISAGNSNNKMVNPTDEDWNNYFTFTKFGYYFGPVTGDDRFYYNQPGSPNLNAGTQDKVIPGFMVGGLDVDAYSSTLDRKMPMSNTGSAVNIYAAGDRIKSSVPTNSTAQYTGTPMASPQMAGMAACLLQAHPDWTPKQVTDWFVNNSQDKMYSAGGTDWSDEKSLVGGSPRVAYFPLNGQNVFTISES